MESKMNDKLYKKQTIYCNNCGNEGHLYRQCRLPVLSYGVLCLNNQNQVLMIRRKDSLSYIELLRGKYDINDHVYITKLLNGCSVSERQQLLDLEFDQLWDKLWFSNNTNRHQTERMLKEYKQSKSNFNKLKDKTMEKLVNSCKVMYTTPEWEFPKGRRSNHEGNLKCAIREFEEETDLRSDEYTLLENVLPLSEEYVGSNGVRYKHVYYIAFYKGSRDLSINQAKYEQFSEIGDIAWMTPEECSCKIRKEQKTKKTILFQINQIIKQWRDDFFLKE